MLDLSRQMSSLLSDIFEEIERCGKAPFQRPNGGAAALTLPQ